MPGTANTINIRVSSAATAAPPPAGSPGMLISPARLCLPPAPTSPTPRQRHSTARSASAKAAARADSWLGWLMGAGGSRDSCIHPVRADSPSARQTWPRRWPRCQNQGAQTPSPALTLPGATNLTCCHLAVSNSMSEKQTAFTDRLPRPSCADADIAAQAVQRYRTARLEIARVVGLTVDDAHAPSVASSTIKRRNPCVRQ